MKSLFYLTVVLILSLILLPGCNLTAATEVPTPIPSSIPVDETPILGISEQTLCLYGPDNNYAQVALLDVGQYFKIVGIDDDITWIDDDITWFQVDPTAIIDPVPPSHPLTEASDSEFTVHCWVPGDKVETSGDLTQVPVIPVPVLGVVRTTGCYAGPDETYDQTASLDVGQWLRILAIDDDITWIDDDITWFQVNPAALVDPDPPHHPLNELSPQPDPPGSQMSLFCWVPGDRVETDDDYSFLPIAFHHPGVRLLQDANCRSGPTRDFPLLSVLSAGSEYGIRACNTPGDAWMVFDPAILNNCWVFANLVEVFGNTDLVMIIDPTPPSLTMPEAPTSLPGVDCSQYNNDPTGCSNNPACKWDPSIGDNGACVNN